MSLNYNSDDACPRSPGLVPVRLRATPSPSPPPCVTQPQATVMLTAEKFRGRKKTRPSQGDHVLIRVMEPNKPDIAQQVGERALNSDSGSEADDEDIEEQSQVAVVRGNHTGNSDSYSFPSTLSASLSISSTTTQHGASKVSAPGSSSWQSADKGHNKNLVA
ncbi:hypothetical protein BU26DRAFT_589638 [Trematosphaeria pertusa]|uniref:Uncharacterized protein n=1 Tax=Trematosphaeria pertusa TaxID=390896 RepID=A0A6A6HS86_9PLEO|nr:uncharacterized protein BU26DRAFT_589638 [Trematosphaeria pertusa]KAF2240290.1 hypothetical protein BU26DRAFT_589638 [Trematosphaeria pertusa]